MGSLLIVSALATVMLVDSALETSVSGSLKLLSLCSAFLLFLTLYCYRITSNFLVTNSTLNVIFLPLLNKSLRLSR